MPRALITGATGQDGRYLAELLLARGYEVHAQSRRPHTAGSTPNLQWHAADIADPAALHELIRSTQPDEIYNLAAMSRPVESWAAPYETAKLNALVPQQICDIVLKERPACRIFQASSSEIFGSSPASPQSETTPYLPHSPYGIAKLYAQQMIGAYRSLHGLHASCGILFNHESPRRPLSYVSQKIAFAAASVSLGTLNSREQDERGKPILQDGIVQLGNLDVRRDFAFAGDVVEAMHLMVQADKPGDYVIGRGEPHSIRDMCEIAFRHVGHNWQDHVRTDPALFRPVDVHLTVADPAKAARQLGWRARTSFEQLVTMMVDHQIKRLSAA